jgi:hypothetical protein
MARISTYTFDPSVTKNDFVIGSDSQTNFTRNYKLQDLSKFFGKQGSSLGDKFAYTYTQSKIYSALNRGEATISNSSQSNSQFGSIQRIYVHEMNMDENDTTAFFQSIQEFGLLRIYNGFRTTDYGIYRVQSINDAGNDVLEIVVDLLQANGTITDGETFVLSASFTLDDKTYTTPELNGNVWQITHNLGKYPSVTIVDTANSVIYGEVRYVDLNNVTITFASSVTGRAHIN